MVAARASQRGVATAQRSAPSPLQLFLAVLAALLFMNEGTGLSQTRVVTQAAVLYMWMVQPSFGAAM